MDLYFSCHVHSCFYDESFVEIFVKKNMYLLMWKVTSARISICALLNLQWICFESNLVFISITMRTTVPSQDGNLICD
jgi:hypothetical protein